MWRFRSFALLRMTARARRPRHGKQSERKESVLKRLNSVGTWAVIVMAGVAAAGRGADEVGPVKGPPVKEFWILCNITMEAQA